MYTKNEIIEIVELSQGILPELKQIAKDYEGKLKVLNAIHEDLVAEQKAISEYKESQIIDCEVNLLGNISAKASKDAEYLLNTICDKFKSESRRLKELEVIEQELKNNIRPVEHVRNALSYYIESMSRVLSMVLEENKEDNNHEK